MAVYFEIGSSMARKQRGLLAGFTLVELLVVISIISLLSSIVFASVNSARTKARVAKAQAELQEFVTMATIAQGESNERLQDMTGSTCSDCVCRGRNVQNVPTTDACYISWSNVLTTVAAATKGVVSGMNGMLRDPWGSPYMLDENERQISASDCRPDTVRSAGPDGIHAGDGATCTGVGDDICFVIPPSRPCP